MANTMNYAEKWQPEILKTLAEGLFSAGYMTANVKWLDAKTFHFTTMKTGGYGAHSRAGGFNRSKLVQADVPYTLAHDRDVEFFVDKADVDESNQTGSAANTTEVFTTENQVPEMDAKFFADISAAAIENSLYIEETTDKTNVYSRIKAGVLAVRKYKMDSEIFISSADMDALELSSELTRKVEFTQVTAGGQSIESRITFIDGIKLIEVFDPERFNTVVLYRDETEDGEAGFTGDIAESSPINFLIADKKRCITVPKIATVYFFAPGSHSQGDGYLYQNRAYWDTFVFPDGVRGIKSVYVSFDMRVLAVTSVAGTAVGDTLLTLDAEIGNTSDYSYAYLTQAGAITLPSYGDDLSAWTAWTYGDDITATTGENIAVAVIDGDSKAVSSGKTVVVSKA